MKKPSPICDIDEIIEKHTAIDEAFRLATIEAFRRHRQAGVPVAIWKNGRVVWADPAKLLAKLTKTENGKVRRKRKPA